VNFCRACGTNLRAINQTLKDLNKPPPPIQPVKDLNPPPIEDTATSLKELKKIVFWLMIAGVISLSMGPLFSGWIISVSFLALLFGLGFIEGFVRKTFERYFNKKKRKSELAEVKSEQAENLLNENRPFLSVTERTTSLLEGAPKKPDTNPINRTK
jgi:hypothetical protein